MLRKVTLRMLNYHDPVKVGEHTTNAVQTGHKRNGTFLLTSFGYQSCCKVSCENISAIKVTLHSEKGGSKTCRNFRVGSVRAESLPMTCHQPRRSQRKRFNAARMIFTNPATEQRRP